MAMNNSIEAIAAALSWSKPKETLQYLGNY
jgi:hypothetical protein